MQIRRTRALGVVAAVMAIVLLAACGATSGGAPRPGDGQANATPGGAKTMIVGTDPTHPPHDFLDGSGHNTGWEYDFMQAVGKKLGRTVVYKNAGFTALIPGLTSKRYDVVLANMGITAERLQQVDMITVFRSGQAFLSRASDKFDFSDLNKLCGHSIGTTSGSVQADLAAVQSKKCTASGAKPVTIKLFATGNDIVLAVQSGRIDTYWTAGPIAQYYADQSGSKLAIVGTVQRTAAVSAIALPKGSALTTKMHAAVQALIDDGTYKQILAKWNLQADAIAKSEVNPKPAA